MPNEFKVRNGLIVDSGVSVISGSLIVLGGITGSLSGSSGGGGSVSDFPFTGSAGISGSLVVNGPISTTNGITASLSGTASYTTFALTASYALTGGSGGGGGAAFPFTGSAGISGSLSVIGPSTVTGSYFIRGTGATSATVAMEVDNSAGNPIFVLRNDLVVQAQNIVMPSGNMTSFPAVSSSLGVFAMGTTTTEALNTNSIALGGGCKSRGANSIAVGLDSKAYGVSSVSMGSGNEASGSYSTAFGLTNTATGIYSFSVGTGNRSSGSYSVTMGGANFADGFRSVGVGESNVTPGSRGMAFGISNTVRGTQDVVIGGNNNSNGSLNVVLGQSLSASGSEQVTTGKWNKPTTTATFVIGNGTNNSTRANIVEVVGNTFMITGSLVTSGSLFSSIHNIIYVVTSSVGIGTAVPSERLHVAAVGSGTDVPLYISGKDTKGGTGYLDFLKAENTAGGTPTPKKFFRISTVGSWEVINNDYTQTIMTLEDNGNMTIAGTLTQNSDASLKTNIQTIPNALEKTLQLRGVEYDRASTNKREIGLIAQEVEEIFPELVSENNGIKSVAYSNVVSILIESIKELKQEINDLREQINAK